MAKNGKYSDNVPKCSNSEKYFRKKNSAMTFMQGECLQNNS